MYFDIIYISDISKILTCSFRDIGYDIKKYTIKSIYLNSASKIFDAKNSINLIFITSSDDAKFFTNVTHNNKYYIVNATLDEILNFINSYKGHLSDKIKNVVLKNIPNILLPNEYKNNIDLLDCDYDVYNINLLNFIFYTDLFMLNKRLSVNSYHNKAISESVVFRINIPYFMINNLEVCGIKILYKHPFIKNNTVQNENPSILIDNSAIRDKNNSDTYLFEKTNDIRFLSLNTVFKVIAYSTLDQLSKFLKISKNDEAIVSTKTISFMNEFLKYELFNISNIFSN